MTRYQIRLPARYRRLLLLLASAMALLLTVALRADHLSLERGNRLLAEGDLEGAIVLYRARSAREPSGGPTLYNLGTVLLRTDPEEGAAALTLVTALGGTGGHEGIRGPDGGGVVEGTRGAGEGGEVLQRAHRNLAYHALTLLEGEVSPDSAMTLLQGAIHSGRIALRLDPTDEGARINLALAQQLLDSIQFPPLDTGQELPPGEDETRLDEVAMTRSPDADGVAGAEPENPRSPEGQGLRTGALTGARESWVLRDPGPLSEAEVESLLTLPRDGTEQVLRGLLWSLRPTIAWWSREPYPGGDW